MHQATLSVAFTWKSVLCILCSYVTMRILGLSAEDEVCKAAQQWVSSSVVHPTLSRPLLMCVLAHPCNCDNIVCLPEHFANLCNGAIACRFCGMGAQRTSRPGASSGWRCWGATRGMA